MGHVLNATHKFYFMWKLCYFMIENIEIYIICHYSALQVVVVIPAFVLSTLHEISTFTLTSKYNKKPCTATIYIHKCHVFGTFYIYI